MWRIWFERHKDGRIVGKGVWPYCYKYKHNAVRRAKKQFDSRESTTCNWIVSQTNPWVRVKEE